MIVTLILYILAICFTALFMGWVIANNKPYPLEWPTEKLEEEKEIDEL